jgi:hypothetical protein
MTAEYQLSITLYFQLEIPRKATAALYIPSQACILVSSVAGVKNKQTGQAH